MKQLTIDEMLDAAQMAGMPTRDHELAVESLANIIAADVARHFGVQILNHASFEPGFGGTCVNFGPPAAGDKTCPYVLSLFDTGDWEDEFGTAPEP